MRVKNLAILILSLIIGFCAVDVQARNNRAGRLFPAKEKYNSKEIEKSIKAAVKFLLSKQKKDGSWEPFGNPQDAHYYTTGPTSLVVYALLESGMKIKDEPIEKALKYIISKAAGDPNTYSVSLRCCALAIASEQYRLGLRKIKSQSERLKYAKKDPYFRQLRRDYHLLIRIAPFGYYGYKCELDKPFNNGNFDQSNSQYGLLGVWAAANEKRDDIPLRYFKAVLKHWLKTQLPDGGWSYYDHTKKSPEATNHHDYASSSSMTCAGLASLFVCIDKLYTKQFTKCKGKVPELKALDKGIDWFSKNFKADYGSKKHYHNFYYLYGVERVALASGFKFFGKHDWFNTGVRWLLEQQLTSGRFRTATGDGVVGGAYAVLFLVRGRNPVLINKLKFNSDWNNRPRDLHWLVKYLGKKYETTMNFQIVTLESEPSEWHDAPFLYISGSQDPKFTDADIDKLRKFVLQGGVIISSTECGGGKFKNGIRKAYKKMFPTYELERCRKKHPLYSMFTEKSTRSGSPAFYCVNNFVRPLIFHTDQDLSKFWQMRDTKGSRKRFYDIISNIMGYCNQIANRLNKRGQSYWPDEKDYTTNRSIDIVRIKYSGVSNPEPLAWERVKLLLARDEKVKVNLSEVKLKELGSSKAKIALLSGVTGRKFTKKERAALKKYVKAGGTLIIDPVGGNKGFKKSVEKLLKKMYKTKGDYVQYSDPLYALKGHEITKKEMRCNIKGSYARSKRNPLRVVKVGKDKRPAVYFCTGDLTFGLLGAKSNAVSGLVPEVAYKVARNIILLTLANKK